MAKKFLGRLFGTGDENEGFVDVLDEGYDEMGSAVTKEEAGLIDYDDEPDYGYKSQSKVINMHSGNKGQKVCILKPTGYDEVMTGAVDMLRNGTIIFLNLSGIGTEVGTRIVDFMTGVAAAFEGRIKKVDTCCYTVAPKNVEWIETIED